MSTRRRKSQAKRRRLVPTLCIAADERRAECCYAEAERLYRRALAIKEKLLTAEHPDVGVTLNNLAVFCKARGRYGEAAAFYGRALLILEKSFGSEHPKVISCRNNYATLTRKMERYHDREKKFRADSNIWGSSATSSSGSQL